jgi:hypothetical protein
VIGWGVTPVRAQARSSGSEFPSDGIRRRHTQTLQSLRAGVHGPLALRQDAIPAALTVFGDQTVRALQGAQWPWVVIGDHSHLMQLLHAQDGQHVVHLGDPSHVGGEQMLALPPQLPSASRRLLLG